MDSHASIRMTGPTGLGVGIPPQVVTDRLAAVEKLQPAWWYDWGSSRQGFESPSYVPMMYRHMTNNVRWRMEEQPGRFWLGPNEPELGGQANMTPDECAKELAAAQRAGADIIWPAVCWTPQAKWTEQFPWTPTRRWPMHWMDRFINLWTGPDPTVVQVHLYGVRGGTEWNELFEDWYDWLESHGLENVRTIVSETNQDHGKANEQFGMLRYLAWRLNQDERMQAVAWFAAYWPRHTSTSLLDAVGNLTALGKAFRALQVEAQAQTETV